MAFGTPLKGVVHLVRDSWRQDYVKEAEAAEACPEEERKGECLALW